MNPVDDTGMPADSQAPDRPDDGSSPSSPRRMRLAILSRNFDSSGGGAERYAVAVAQKLAQQH